MPSRRPRARTSTRFAVERLEGRSLLSAGTIAFGATSQTVADTAEGANFTVTRSGGSTGTVTVQVQTADGTARAGIDYQAQGVTLTFGPGQTTMTVNVEIHVDPVAFVAPRTFSVTLSDPTGGATLGDPSVETLTMTHTPASGDLDGTFATGGQLKDDLQDGNSATGASVVAPDGSTYVVETTTVFNTPPAPLIAVDKFNPDGTIDTSYGTDGVAVVAAPSSAYQFDATAMALEPDGKLVFAGAGGVENSGTNAGLVFRLNPDGTPDTSFGVGGTATYAVPGGAAGEHDYLSGGMAILPNGDIVVAGFSEPLPGSAAAFGVSPEVLNPDGSPDLAFGPGGMVTMNLHGGIAATTGLADYLPVLAMPDGTFVIGGTGLVATGGTATRMDLWRFEPDGSLDTAFGTGGKALGPLGDAEGRLALTADGEILQLAGVNSGDPDGVELYQANGQIDTSFGTSGFATAGFQPYAVDVEPDGDILLSGVEYAGSVFYMELLNAKGAPVSTFGQGGSFIPPVGGQVYALGLVPGNRIVATGINPGTEPVNGFNDIETARFLAQPMAVNAVALTAVNGVPLEGFKVATFSDPGGEGGAADFSATVDWGDGSSPTSAMLSDDGSGDYTVIAGHTYAATGPYTMTVTIDNTVGVPSVGTSKVVVIAPASRLAVTAAPANATLNGTFGLAVSAENASGQVDPFYDGSVTLTPGGPTGATLGGNLTATMVNGVATFKGLSLNKVGLGYSIGVTSGGLTATSATIGVTQPANDFLAAGATEPTVFRRVNAGLADWFVKGDPAITGTSGHAFGSGTLDIPLSGDFDGDGKADLAIYRPSTAQWFLAGSGSALTPKLLTTFGEVDVDVPAPGNYSGNGTTVPGLYRPTTGQWFIDAGGAGHNITLPVTFPTNATPVPADYDDTGEDEPATFAKGVWTIDGPGGLHAVVFGGPTDLPIPGDYDATATNHAAEPAVWRPSTGQFFIHGPTGNRTLQFKVGDIPAPGDYDGIGETEAAVYRPGTGQWLVIGPNDTTPRVVATYGAPGDIPTLAPLVYRNVIGQVHAEGRFTGEAFPPVDPPASIPIDLGGTSRDAPVSPPAARAVTPTFIAEVLPVPPPQGE